MSYKAAVIGLGRMGSTFDDEITQGGSIFLPYCHAPTYCAHPQIDLIAGADPHHEQRALFGERWGVDRDHLYANHLDLLEKARPDIVSVATTARYRPPRCSGADGRAALEVAIALRESHRRGGVRIDLPIEDRSFKIFSSETQADHTPARVRRLNQ